VVGRSVRAICVCIFLVAGAPLPAIFPEKMLLFSVTCRMKENFFRPANCRTRCLQPDGREGDPSTRSFSWDAQTPVANTDILALTAQVRTTVPGRAKAKTFRQRAGPPAGDGGRGKNAQKSKKKI